MKKVLQELKMKDKKKRRKQTYIQDQKTRPENNNAKQRQDKQPGAEIHSTTAGTNERVGLQTTHRWGQLPRNR